MKAPLLAVAFALAAAAAPAPAGAVIYHFQTFLSGANESPANASPGTGFGDLLWDTDLHTATYNVTFSGLVANTIAAHTHSPTPGQAGPNFTVATTTPSYPLFPLGVTAGSWTNTFDLTQAASYNPAYVTAFGSVAASESALLTGLLAGQAYLNIHTSTFTGGEIRGNWAQVPEPATWAMMIAGFGLAGVALRRRRPVLAKVRA